VVLPFKSSVETIFLILKKNGGIFLNKYKASQTEKKEHEKFRIHKWNGLNLTYPLRKVTGTAKSNNLYRASETEFLIISSRRGAFEGGGKGGGICLLPIMWKKLLYIPCPLTIRIRTPLTPAIKILGTRARVDVRELKPKGGGEAFSLSDIFCPGSHNT